MFVIDFLCMEKTLSLVPDVLKGLKDGCIPIAVIWSLDWGLSSGPCYESLLYNCGLTEDIPDWFLADGKLAVLTASG